MSLSGVGSNNNFNPPNEIKRKMSSADFDTSSSENRLMKKALLNLEHQASIRPITKFFLCLELQAPHIYDFVCKTLPYKTNSQDPTLFSQNMFSLAGYLGRDATPFLVQLTYEKKLQLAIQFLLLSPLYDGEMVLETVLGVLKQHCEAAQGKQKEQSALFNDASMLIAMLAQNNNNLKELPYFPENPIPTLSLCINCLFLVQDLKCEDLIRSGLVKRNGPLHVSIISNLSKTYQQQQANMAVELLQKAQYTASLVSELQVFPTRPEKISERTVQLYQESLQSLDKNQELEITSGEEEKMTIPVNPFLEACLVEHTNLNATALIDIIQSSLHPRNA